MQVYDVRKEEDKPVLESGYGGGKHSDCVWEVPAQPRTLKPQTRNPKLETLNSKLQTQNSKPQT